jgi:broad specificity phosphatase PhoE
MARHGERLDFADPSWAASASRPHDPPLAPLGFWQAERTAVRLADEGIAHVVSSPFLRAVQTAYPLARALEMPLKIEPGLSEWLNRDWFSEPPDLLPMGKLIERFPRIDPAYQPRDGARYGENGDEAWTRSARTCWRLLEALPGNLALFGHGVSVLGAAWGLLRRETDRARLPEDVPAASLLKLVSENGDWSLERVCDTSHL